MSGALYRGDNLAVMRERIATGSVDLVYLDPPFNSRADYKLANGAFGYTDVWHWDEAAGKAYAELSSAEGPAAGAVRALKELIGESGLAAYLIMMAPRLVELHRALRQAGTMYLHCDAAASHYLKVLLDSVFGPSCFRNEIIWKRSNPKSLSSTNFPTCTDTILRYSKTAKATYYQPYEAHDPEYVEKAYRYRDNNGRYRLLPLLNPNDDRPNLTYEFLGVTRVWRWTRERMLQAYEDGLVVQLKPGAVPQYKKYLNDSKGRTVTNCWTDIPQAAGNEPLGYPTQKPVALLDRIIQASSNEGDVVLDPFCGSGTTLYAAQRLGRRWIGIDVSEAAVSVASRRLGLPLAA